MRGRKAEVSTTSEQSLLGEAFQSLVLQEQLKFKTNLI